MATTTTDDELRAEVERVLQAIVAATVTVPVRILTAVPRCLVRRASSVRRRMAEPARVARSLVDLVGRGPQVRGVIVPDDAPTPAEAPLHVEPAGIEPDVEVAPTSVTSPDAASDDAAAADLPIDEYESLAASQVVARLPMLTPSELEAVQSFEIEHRGRRTVLGKIEQLLAPT